MNKQISASKIFPFNLINLNLFFQKSIILRCLFHAEILVSNFKNPSFASIIKDEKQAEPAQPLGFCRIGIKLRPNYFANQIALRAPQKKQRYFCSRPVLVWLLHSISRLFSHSHSPSFFIFFTLADHVVFVLPAAAAAATTAHNFSETRVNFLTFMYCGRIL